MSTTKKINTEYGDVTSTADVSHTDNGQVLLKITSKLGGAVHTHTVTVGSVDGHDSVAALSESELAMALQAHLDAKRDEAVQILSGRAKVAKVSSRLA